MTDELALRLELIETCHKMSASGLTFGTSGNASARLSQSEFLITPSGVAYDALQPDDMVIVDSAGNAKGRYQPSSEWRFHKDILNVRPEVNAIVHTHSHMATALACQHKEIPAFHYMVAVAGGDSIRCAPYATFGTAELSRHVVSALDGRMACLMANHGQVALGASLDEALKMAGEVETLATMYWHALQGGTPVLLGKDEMAMVVEKFKTYGNQSMLNDDEVMP